MVRSVQIDQPQPTWKQGFARSASDSVAPWAWRGLVGAWSAGLGITGGTLRDVSGKHQNGTLTSMDPATDWVVDDGRYVLDFDGSNDHVVLGKKIIATEVNSSVFCWIKTSASSIPSGRAIYSERSGATAIWKIDSLVFGSTDNELLFTHRDDSNTLTQISGVVTINDGEWHHVGVTKKGTAIKIWVDGVEDNNGTLNGNDTLTVTNSSIGSDITATVAATQGPIDDVFVYNRSLSPTEVRKLYELGRGGILKRKSFASRIALKEQAVENTTAGAILYGSNAPPSWKNGFARSQSQSTASELWPTYGWSPGLGSTGGTLRDVSGRHNHGTLTNMDPATDWVIDDGRYALVFDGTNEFVNLGNVTLSAPLSISFWGLTTTVTSADEQTWMGNRNGSTSNFVVGIEESGASNYSRFYYYNASFQVWRTTTQPLTANTWHHHVWVYDGVTNPTLYVDGVAFSTTYDLGSGYPALPTNSEDTYIGDIISPTSESLSGKIDDVFLYSRVLSLAEVRKLYNLRRGGIFQRKHLVIGKSEAIVSADGCRILLAPRLSSPTIGNGICWELGPYS